MSRRVLPAALAAASLLALPGAAQAATPTTWLCKPGLAQNPCARSLDTTVQTADGGSRVERAAPARRAKVDCFYVYPTVSAQPRTNATLTRDPEIKAIATFQAGRFTRHCRMFAPVYRQLTLRAIATPRAVSGPASRRAYGDVRDAWREYLRRHNRGRGVVLIGHSQGTYMLRELVRREIDRRAAVRRRLVSALLIGGNVTVRRGGDAGGDFRSVRACRSATQLRCVVAYSMFDQQPVPGARFGLADRADREILCTNPGALGGGTARLDTYVPTAMFPGPIGAAIRASVSAPAVAPTPWVAYPGRATARCARGGGASWLQVDEVEGDPRPTFTPELGPTWGLHLGDVNIALGQLTDLVRRQAAAYAKRS